MIYVVTQDGLSIYPVEDDDVIETLVTKNPGNKYNVVLKSNGWYKGEPYVRLGSYDEREEVIDVIRELANKMSYMLTASDDYNLSYFMPEKRRRTDD